MAFDLNDWRSQVAARWREWAGDTQAAMARLGVKSAYGLLVASTWLPLLAAYTQDVGPAIAALTGLTAGVGTNLIANIVQRKYDQQTAAKDIEALAERDPQARDELDALIDQLAVVQAAQASLGDSWSAFLKQLREDLKRINSPRLQTMIDTGGGAYIAGSVYTQGGPSIGRDQVIVEAGAIYAPGAKFEATDDKAKDMAALERRYLEWVFARSSPLQLRGIDPRAIGGRGGTLALWAVYIALDTTFLVPDGMPGDWVREIIVAGRWLDKHKGDVWDSYKARAVSVLEVVGAASHAVLIGAPGAGKSTFLNYVMLCLSGARLEDKDWLARIEPTWTHGALLPVRVTLRDFAARSIPAEAKAGRAQMLWEHIALDLTEAGFPTLTERIQSLAGSEGVVFMLDGLDEVPEGPKRDRVREAVDDFARGCGQQSRVIVTARPYAYDDPARRLSEFSSPFTLAPFDDEHAQQFITAWYGAVEKAGWVTAREAKDKTAALLSAARRVDLRPIAERPLLLTLMATLHSSRGKLPDDRADLYNDIVELLLWHWNESKGDEQGLLAALDMPSLKLADIRRKIEQVAFQAHEAQGGAEGPADIDGDDIVRAFRPLLGGSYGKAEQVVEYIEKRAGLLNGLGERDGRNWYAFPHRTFQEYLAGCHLAGRDDFRVEAPKKVRAAPAQWHEVFILAARHARADRGIPAADALIGGLPVQEFIGRHGQPDENQWRSAVIAGLALLEIGQVAISSDPLSQLVRDRVAGWLLRMIETPRLLSLTERIEAGNTLGRLGDPRFTVEKTADGTEYILPPVVKVEAGPFEMGSGEGEQYARDNEYSKATRNRRHLVEVAEFSIGKYPVTNTEYRCFVQATSQHEPRHWSGGDVPPGLENHPAVNVAWHDATKYCEWLSAVSGRTVRLPSEAEWEMAARWDRQTKHSRVYPWSDEWDAARCNTSEEGPVSTTPVGMYPDGISPGGILDTAGNVWEWCQSKYVPYPYSANDGREDLSGGDARVVRGGSWYDLQWRARCAFRFGGVPGYFYPFLGFRVVVSLAS